jgi:hypothetical protein
LPRSDERVSSIFDISHDHDLAGIVMNGISPFPKANAPPVRACQIVSTAFIVRPHGYIRHGENVKLRPPCLDSQQLSRS